MWRRAVQTDCCFRQCTRQRRLLALTSKPTVHSLADVEVDFQRKLGFGGFSSVYTGRLFQTTTSVAVKVMLPACSAEPYGGEADLASAIMHEWEVAERLVQSGTSHQHVVDYFGNFRVIGAEANAQGLLLPSWLQTSDPSPEMQLSFFIMEHLQGMSLEKYIQMSGALQESEAQLVTRAICQGLQHCHDLNIVHRDVKPDNVVFSEPPNSDSRGSWKLIDFSAAGSMLGPLTEMVGTPGYIAPEVLLNKEPYGFKCDVFSLGCSVHAMLTNMYLPRRHPRLGMVLKLPPHLSPSGRDFVESLLVGNPEARPTVAEALQHPWLQDTST